MAENRDFNNDGVILFGNESSGLPESYYDNATIIITGLARSGTSMIAHVLRTGNVYLGDVLDDTVHEDIEVSKLIASRDRVNLRALIADRNRTHQRWAFKRPELHEMLTPSDIGLFRNPAVILSFRDPVAIAKRNVVAEFIAERVAFEAAIASTARLGAFAWNLSCPLLAVSYEKAIVDPESFTDSIIKFCRLSPKATVRSDMIAGVVPAPKHYAVRAALHFEGHVDEIDAYGTLTGWCRQMHTSEAVSLTLVVDGEPLRNFRADAYREDLEKAGIGNGRHAFRVDIRDLGLSEETRLTVQVQGRTYRLTGSNRTLRELQQKR